MKEKLVNLFEATPTVRITSSCLQKNHKKEKLFGMFNAKHGKGIRAGFDLELTCLMLSIQYEASSRFSKRHVAKMVIERVSMYPKFGGAKVCACKSLVCKVSNM